MRALEPGSRADAASLGRRRGEAPHAAWLCLCLLVGLTGCFKTYLVHPVLHRAALEAPEGARVAVKALSEGDGATAFLRAQAVRRGAGPAVQGQPYRVEVLHRRELITVGSAFLALGGGLLGVGLYLTLTPPSCRELLCGLGEGVLGLGLTISAAPALLVGLGTSLAALGANAEVSPRDTRWRFLDVVPRR